MDERNRVFESGFVKLGGEKVLHLDACPTRFCLVRADIPHSSRLRTDVPHGFVASAAFPMRTTGKFAGTYHFYVAKGCDGFRISGECGPNRVLPLVIHDPEGRVVDTEFRRRRGWQFTEVTVPASLRGRVWSMSLRINADLRLTLEGPLPPLLFLKPEWARTVGRCMATAAGEK